MCIVIILRILFNVLLRIILYIEHDVIINIYSIYRVSLFESLVSTTNALNLQYYIQYNTRYDINPLNV